MYKNCKLYFKVRKKIPSMSIINFEYLKYHYYHHHVVILIFFLSRIRIIFIILNLMMMAVLKLKVIKNIIQYLNKLIILEVLS